VNDFVKPGVFADDPSIEHVKHLGKQYCYYYERLIYSLSIGDIVIAPSYVQRQCIKDEKYKKKTDNYDNTNDGGVSLAMSTIFDTNERIILLLVHGMIHLLGYDHEYEKDWFLMTKKENEVLQKLNLS
jgi:hypothetical protein